MWLELPKLSTVYTLVEESIYPMIDIESENGRAGPRRNIAILQLLASTDESRCMRTSSPTLARTPCVASMNFSLTSLPFGAGGKCQQACLPPPAFLAIAQLGLPILPYLPEIVANQSILSSVELESKE